MQKPLWEPSFERKLNANMTKFMAFVNERYSCSFAEYHELYDWSVSELAGFWAAVWDFCGVRAAKHYDLVLDNREDLLNCRWFPGAKLNFAANLLRYRDRRPAIVFSGEGRPAVRLSYAQLYDQVARLALALREMGVAAGDRVAGFMPNRPETIIAMLATTSLGAIWSSCSPDFGINGVLDRFGQIQPKVLFTADGYYYNGQTHDCLQRVAQVVQAIATVEKVVLVPYTSPSPDLSALPGAVLFNNFLAQETGLTIDFAQLPFDHPLYIMYSSGTTGVPKCIVHGAGGTLLQHLKELVLHTDLKRSDTIFYYTTCGWMMWNWLVSSLAAGATLLLYDGSPFYPAPDALFKLAQDEKVTIFGTSAKYLAAIEKEGVKPGASFDLSPLRAILSTGSPLSGDSFAYVYREIKKDICLSSISGGTDIVSCFCLGNPIGPVYAGELQCRGLGMKVEAFDARGKAVLNQKGELVCTKPFPSRPIYFWHDQDGVKYKKAYFSVYPHVWHHGDFIEINDATGGVIIYGRSDATLNPGGVRIGTAEIYRQVELLAEVTDSLVIGQNWDNDVRVILFVKLAPGVQYTDALVKKIKTAIRVNTTPRHVPAKVIPVADIPYTISGKKVELAVRNIIHREPVDNRDALANPSALELYQDLPELQS
ncbi:MAG: acetoacetate--CoA ligase [Firmicutes bacterium]|nr:acetoacetate--CoA ligase [Bacillota bacterium]